MRYIWMNKLNYFSQKLELLSNSFQYIYRYTVLYVNQQIQMQPKFFLPEGLPEAEFPKS